MSIIRMVAPLLCLITGAGVAQAQQSNSSQEAIAEIRKSAEQGDAEAQYNLGLMYKIMATASLRIMPKR